MCEHKCHYKVMASKWLRPLIVMLCIIVVCCCTLLYVVVHCCMLLYIVVCCRCKPSLDNVTHAFIELDKTKLKVSMSG